MKKHLSRGLVAAACASALLAPAASAAPSNVTVRAEGKAATLIPRTAVRTDTRTVNKDGQAGHDCTGTSAAGALEIASGGDWAGTWFQPDYFVSRIRGEAPQGNDFFSFWLNDRESSVGICQAELQDGDEVLFFVARCDFDPNTFQCTNPPVLPLDLREVPGRATPGAPFNVRVVELSTNGTPTPVAGATVTGGDAPAVSGADGIATVRVSSRGPASLRAEKENRARTALEPVCVTDGQDGFCGTTTPAGERVPDGSGTSLAATRDRSAPLVRLLGIREGQVFSHRRAPKLLRGTAQDPSGLLMVKVRLTRNDRGRCSAYSVKRERFVRTRCGVTHGWYSKVGDRATWEYQLASRLPRGRYVIDVNAVDKAYNRDDARRRGQNRLVFRVR